MLLFITFVLTLIGACVAVEVQMSSVNDWGGKFEGKFNFPISEYTDGWEAILKFSEPVTGVSEWMGDVVKTSSDNKQYVIVNKAHTGIQQVGNTLSITIQAAYSGSSPPSATGLLVNLGHDGQTVPPVPTSSSGDKYNYDEVLMKSILFYEAQRSGKLPDTNRIPWRGDSALHDKGDNDEDLTGGWYDAGDHVKFGFPMSASVTLLAWGLLEYKDAYTAAGQLEYMYDCIRWPLEWLLKAHTGPNELYVQVGDGGKDHSYWGRPEDMTMARPAYKITASSPGSDIAAEYAAAMAASYLVFKDKDPAFATQLLQNAKEIYDFALNNKGIYSQSVNAAAAYYRRWQRLFSECKERQLCVENASLKIEPGSVFNEYGTGMPLKTEPSNAYEDELSWGGAWLYKATNESKYLQDAETYYQPGASWGQSWDDKTAGCQILLYQMTGEDKYKQDIEATFTDWMPGGSIPYSPKGLAFRSQWGSLRYASNMAFMAELAADAGVHPAEYRAWAKSQIDYALGDTGKSFVVGFGVHSPQRPHHRGSSCPMEPAPCAWFDQQQKGPNPHVLYGALVGGPNGQDSYTDDRNNYISNEVACDYNAGFQSAVAGLESLSLNGE